MRILRMLRSARVSSIVLCVVLCAATAEAQQAGPVASTGETGAMTEKARQLYADGMKAAMSRRWGEAHASFLAAWGLKRQYQIAGNLGAAEMQLGRYREAAEHLAYYLREAPATKVKERANVQALLDEARKHVGAVVLTVEPAGAAVIVDGVVLGNAPLSGEVFVEEGARTIEARLDGYEVAKTTVDAAKGTSREVALTLVKREARSAATGSGGAAAVELSGSGGVGGVGGSGGNEDADEGPRKAVIITGVAASSVAIVGGVVFAIVATSRANDADQQEAELRAVGGPRPCGAPNRVSACEELDSKNKTSDMLSSLSVWSFVAGGVIGVSTAIYAVGTPKAKPTTPRVLPVATVRSGGLMIVGQW